MIIEVSNICRAFDNNCVGTKVVNEGGFSRKLMDALDRYVMPENGQGFIPLPLAFPYVLSGDCAREGLTENDFIVRQWRGEMMMFAKRREQHATSCAAIVYTAEAYFADPQVDAAEKERRNGATHVLVAVIGSRGPKPTLSSSRFVRNLAGGNNDFAFGQKSYTDLVAISQEIVAYEAAWVTVADPVA